MIKQFDIGDISQNSVNINYFNELKFKLFNLFWYNDSIKLPEDYS